MQIFKYSEIQFNTVICCTILCSTVQYNLAQNNTVQTFLHFLTNGSTPQAQAFYGDSPSEINGHFLLVLFLRILYLSLSFVYCNKKNYLRDCATCTLEFLSVLLFHAFNIFFFIVKYSNDFEKREISQPQNIQEPGTFFEQKNSLPNEYWYLRKPRSSWSHPTSHEGAVI